MRHVTEATTVRDWFEEHSGQFQRMIWPPRSPDMNPIEHLWDIIESGGGKVKNLKVTTTSSDFKDLVRFETALVTPIQLLPFSLNCHLFALRWLLLSPAVTLDICHIPDCRRGRGGREDHTIRERHALDEDVLFCSRKKATTPRSPSLLLRKWNWIAAKDETYNERMRNDILQQIGWIFHYAITSEIRELLLLRTILNPSILGTRDNQTGLGTPRQELHSMAKNCGSFGCKILEPTP
ncbi:hypothetical protein CEXT_312881 [Caerostris extrusa]|uniref:Tc1-like transposase DDE domain-containing protein n=1 Tax=Caerostris extrusa TaxID=172846 RepID=A0AAV4SAA0_CAEEX|nr:hypothetical protein CEXT_312881 [Caerostris extrusa]